MLGDIPGAEQGVTPLSHGLRRASSHQWKAPLEGSWRRSRLRGVLPTDEISWMSRWILDCFCDNRPAL